MLIYIIIISSHGIEKILVLIKPDKNICNSINKGMVLVVKIPTPCQETVLQTAPLLQERDFIPKQFDTNMSIYTVVSLY